MSSEIHSCPPTPLPYFWIVDDDDTTPLRYRFNPPERINTRLAQLSAACAPLPGRAWAASFQPLIAPGIENQDRWAVESWGDGRWIFAGVWDGHVGSETAQHASEHLPGLIKRALFSLLQSTQSPSPEDVSRLLSEQLQIYDRSLADDLVALFPHEDVESLPIAELEARINDCRDEPGNFSKIIRCMRGATAVILLVDLLGRNLWSANLGDSEAVLALQTPDGFIPDVITALHQASEPSEVAEMNKAHPSEEEQSIFYDRVLGVLAVTRALGDHMFKLPAVYTSRIFIPTEPTFLDHRVEKILAYSKTPPYVSAVPHVVHRELRSDQPYVVLFTDGLKDIYKYVWSKEAENACVESLGVRREGDGADNLALRVLREALGGDDAEKCSLFMELQLDEKWMDDTTVVVLSLQ